MKYLKRYLVVSSVIVHVVVVVALVWAAPLIGQGMDFAKSFRELVEESEIGVVEDVSEIVRGDSKYRGYLVNYKGQDLFVSGKAWDDIKEGDVVNVVVSEVPRSPMLMVIVSKKDDSAVLTEATEEDGAHDGR
jgi:hypothetical protein